MEENGSEEMSILNNSSLIEEENSRYSLITMPPEQSRRTTFDDSIYHTISNISIRTIKSDRTSLFIRRDIKGLNVDNSQASFFPNLSELLQISDISLSFSSESTEISYKTIDQSWAETDIKFFEELGAVPNVSTIKLTTADRAPVRGTFTNPLTGSPVISSTELSNSQDNEEEEIVENGEEQEYTEEFSFEDFDAKYPKDKDEKPPEEESTLLEDLWRNTMLKVHSPHDFHPSFPIDDKLNIIHQQISSFLDDIIKEVAGLCELNTAVNLFEEKLDKNLLFKHFEERFFELFVEKKIHSFLERKIVEFYRRKGKLRNVTPNPLEEEKDICKYKETISHLDVVLGAEKYIEINLPKKIEELTRNLDDDEVNAKQEVLKFEKIVKHTLKCEAHPRLVEVVDRCLRDMAALRDEISQIRLVLIQNQHTISALQLQINELNYLGGGLYLPEYISLENDTAGLDKKIEDRKQTLAKQHERFQRSLHTMAHLKFSTRILREKVRKQTTALNFLSAEKNGFRKLVHKLNLDHDRRRREIHHLTVKCGLLVKPALLNDYDETIKNIAEQRKNVELLRQTKLDIEAKIRNSEKTLKSYRKK